MTVDLRELAIDREGDARSTVGGRPHVLTRYVLPSSLILGFLSLIGWASRDIIFPSRRVTVVPVMTTREAPQQAGTPLFNAAGWIEPRPTPVRVAALAPGVVENLLVVEDQRVTAGEVVAELVKDDARLAHERAIADLRFREAEREQAEALRKAAQTRFEYPVHLEALLAEAEAALAKIETELTNLPFESQRAEANLEYAAKDYEGNLAAKEVVAGRDIDAAKSELDSATALVDELRHREESLKKEQAALILRRDAVDAGRKLLVDEIRAWDEAAAQVKAATARVDQARVAAAEASLRLDRMSVRSPIDGRVFRLIGHPGARIGSGMTQKDGHDGSTIVTLYRPDMLQVRVDVRFEDILDVSLGQPVRIDNPTLTSPLTGRVLFIGSEADKQKNTLQVKVEIPSPPRVFKPEMLVDVTFLSPDRGVQTSPTAADRIQATRIYIPEELIRQDDNESFVWLADQSTGVARRTIVQPGRTTASGMVEITGGLNISSRIIDNGSHGLQDGDRIVVTGESTGFLNTRNTKQENTSG